MASGGEIETVQLETPAGETPLGLKPQQLVFSHYLPFSNASVPSTVRMRRSLERVHGLVSLNESNQAGSVGGSLQDQSAVCWTHESTCAAGQWGEMEVKLVLTRSNCNRLQYDI